MKYIVVCATLLMTACLSKKPERTGLEGKTLPEFSLQMHDSTTWINTKDIKSGKPMVFFIFSSHCPYCKSQLSKIVDNMESLSGLSFYMITDEPFLEMKEFYRTNQLEKYPNIKVCRDTAAFLGTYLSIKGIPFLALYDKNKQLARAFAGPTSPGLIKDILSE